jgi:hypothetical protein
LVLVASIIIFKATLFICVIRVHSLMSSMQQMRLLSETIQYSILYRKRLS